MSAPIVTQPPIIIDLAVPARDEVNGNHYFGPFVVGSHLYAVLISQKVPPLVGNRWLNVYKSSNGGLSWTSMDTANRPITEGEFDCLLIGTVFTIIYIPIPAVLKVITFDTGTDTFGAPGPDGPAGNNCRIAQFSNGDFCVLYKDTPTGLGQCNAIIYSGGAWGAAVLLPNTKNIPSQVIMGANNIAQLFYYDLIGRTHVFLRTFTDGGVLGAETPAFSGPAGVTAFAGRSVIWNGNFSVPFYTGTGPVLAGIFTGAPYTAPVWTFATVDTLPWGTAEADQDGFSFIDPNNNLVLFWNAEDFSDPNPANIIDRMYYAMNSGSGFAPPVLFYDAVTNPQLQDPGIDPFSQFLHTLSAVLLPNGRFGVITAMEENGFCAGYFLNAAFQATKRCLQ